MPPSSAPAPPRRLVIATANPGKLAEFRALLADLPVELTSLGELALPAPEETGESFLANATLKARHAAALCGHGAIADDSGLEVDALGGAPGIFSARYAGRQGDDAANNEKLIGELRGVPPERRTARYRCVLVCVRNAQDSEPLVSAAVWEGLIVDAAQGAGGFGYDPHFFLPSLGVTAAQLAPGDKNRVSHRGRALRALRERL